MTYPYANSAATRLIADRIATLSGRKTQARIAAEVGFPNANMLTFLKTGRNKVPLDRVPALARALEVDAALLMRLALEQAVGKTGAAAIVEVFGTPITANERAWLEEIRDASANTDPRLTARSRKALRAIFGKQAQAGLSHSAYQPLTGGIARHNRPCPGACRARPLACGEGRQHGPCPTPRSAADRVRP